MQGAGEVLQQKQRRAMEMLSVLGGGGGGGGRRNNVFVSGDLLQQEKGKVKSIAFSRSILLPCPVRAPYSS